MTTSVGYELCSPSKYDTGGQNKLVPAVDAPWSLPLDYTAGVRLLILAVRVSGNGLQFTRALRSEGQQLIDDSHHSIWAGKIDASKFVAVR